MEEKRNFVGRLESVSLTSINKPLPLHLPAVNTKKIAYLRKYGIVKPVTLRIAEKNMFDIVAGANTIECWQMLGNKYIPAYIVELTDEEYLIHRMLLNAFEQPMDTVFLSDAVIKIMQFLSIFDLYRISPYSAAYISDLIELHKFDWSEFKKQVVNEQKSLFDL